MNLTDEEIEALPTMDSIREFYAADCVPDCEPVRQPLPEYLRHLITVDSDAITGKFIAADKEYGYSKASGWAIAMFQQAQYALRQELERAGYQVPGE